MFWMSYSKYSFVHGLELLNRNVEVLKFVEDTKGYEIIGVYVEYVVNNLEIVEVGDEGLFSN